MEIIIRYIKRPKNQAYVEKTKRFKTLEQALSFWYRHECFCIEKHTEDEDFVYDIDGDVWIKIKGER